MSYDDYRAATKKYNVIPIYTSCVFDLETPVSLYIKTGGWSKPYSFLLESVIGGESRARYSFIGISNYATLRGKGRQFEFALKDSQNKETLKTSDPLQALKMVSSRYTLFQADELAGFYAGLVGFFTYDTIRYYEKIAEHPKADSTDRIQNSLQLDDLVYVIPEMIAWFDHAKSTVKLIRNIFLTKGSDLNEEYDRAIKNIKDTLTIIDSKKFKISYDKLKKPELNTNSRLEWNCNTTEEEYLQMVDKAREYIRRGDVFQVVLSKRYYREYPYDPFFLYRGLRTVNPSPYMFYLNFPGAVLIGSSPEILIKKEGRKLILRPIAGTIHRGFNQKEDEFLSEKLLNDDKEKAEHIMLVDLGRNDMGKICEYGSVHLDEYMNIEKYSHVMHIVSNITGTLRKDQDAFQCIWASFPAGTVSGAPKVRAMEIIEELEKESRGAYAGCIGYFNFDGDMDTAITLRTMLVKDKKIYAQAGSGVVFDSSPEGENEEVFRKANALFKAVDLFYEHRLERSK